MPRRYVPDGVVEREVEAHSFVGWVRMCGTSYSVTLPLPLAKALQLKKGDLVEVVVRKVDEEYAVREYGYISGRNVWQTLRVKCPICGEEGTAVFRRQGLSISVAHGHAVRHYVPRLLYPEFYAETYAKLLELGRIPEDVKDLVKKRISKVMGKGSGGVVR